MNSQANQEQVDHLFTQAVELAANERESFLSAACDGDAALFAEVQKLLAAHGEAEKSSKFLAPLPAGQNLFGSSLLRPHPLVGQQIGPYQVERWLGGGGFGDVYFGFRTEDYRQTIAIKVVRSDIFVDDRVLARFELERQLLADLQHEHIARLLFGGTLENGRPYIVMEYVEGRPLNDYCDGKRLDVNERLALFRQVCQAVAYAHRYSVIHRDIKPGNILVTNDGNVRLLDFGIAKMIEPASQRQMVNTSEGGMPLTPQYASPEQVRGQHVSTATDVYSLGVVLYELLTGHPPYQFRHSSPAEVERVICHQEPTKPSVVILEPAHLRRVDGREEVLSPEQNAEPRNTDPQRLKRVLEGDLEQVVLMALSKEPHRRYSTVEALVQDLDSFGEGLPVVARPVGRLEKAMKWCRRKPALAGLMAASAFVFATAVGWGVRELHAHRHALMQQNEILISNAEKFAQRGDWQAALANLDRVNTIGRADSVRVQLARIRGLIAVNSSAYPKEVEALYKRDDLGDYAALAYLMKAQWLMVCGEQEAAIEMLQRARSEGGLPPAEAALADALLAETSPELVRKLELAVKLDPLSYNAQQYLVAALFASGRFDDCIRQGEIATTFFPESPEFPMQLALAAAAKGDQRKVDQYMEMPACSRLLPDFIQTFSGLLKAEVQLYEVIGNIFDIDVTLDEFETMRQRQAEYMPLIIQLVKYMTGPGQFAKYTNQESNRTDKVGPTLGPPPRYTTGPFEEALIPCLARAYRPLRDVLSMRTMGFLVTGKGNKDRIDRLIKECEESSRIHPDGMFQFIRGRLLYARGRLDEAAAAYAMSSSSPSFKPVLQRDALTHAARCYFELYKMGHPDALPEALRFVKQRLEISPVKPKHAKILSGIALEAGDFDAARRLLHQAGKGDEDSWIALRWAEIELGDGHYLEAVKHVRQITEDSEGAQQAKRIRAEALAKSQQHANAVADEAR